MIILGIESSCDETSAAVIEAKKKDKKVKILSNITASSLALHAKTGGIIPEAAAREQIKYILPVIKKTLLESGVDSPDIDAISVTTGPGLIGSLLVGTETAKTLSYALKKPLIPVNHLIGHIYANFIKSMFEKREIEFPAVVLIVSGGHSDLLLMINHGKLKWLGGTRDDAAGEAFDKIGRLLKLSYPGGPSIEKAAKKGNSKAFHFPRPMIGSNDFDFSFSGLKTAVLREIQTTKHLNNETISDISASTQQAIIDVLIKKTLKAAEEYKARSILISGGVAANQKLRDRFQSLILNNQSSIKFFAPEKWLCADNAAMIAATAFFNYNEMPWQKVDVNPELYFEQYG